MTEILLTNAIIFPNGVMLVEASGDDNESNCRFDPGTANPSHNARRRRNNCPEIAQKLLSVLLLAPKQREFVDSSAPTLPCAMGINFAL
jgi:hypothetical protein